MIQKIHLNGGPMHDKVVTLVDDRDHFHVIEPLNPQDLFALGDTPTDAVIKTREGTYSRVRYSHNEFEWDGWRSHD